MNNNKKNQKRLKYSISSLLMNNRFLVICSFVIAFILWLWVAIEQSPIVTRVVESVPVTIEYENSISKNRDLQIFGNDKFTIDITVTGKKYIVSSLEADDFKVIAKTDTVVNSGMAQLKLYVQAKEESIDFTISDYSESSIEVFFDKLTSVDINVELDIASVSEGNLKKGFQLGEPEYLRTIKVSGPSTVLRNIEYIKAEVSALNEPITSSLNVNAKLSIKTADNSQVDLSMLRFNSDNYEEGKYFDDISSKFNVMIPLYEEKTLPTYVSFENVPKDISIDMISYKISPSTVKTGVIVGEDITKYEVGTIDVGKVISGQKVFEFEVDKSNPCGVADANGKEFDKFTVIVEII